MQIYESGRVPHLEIVMQSHDIPMAAGDFLEHGDFVAYLRNDKRSDNCN